MDHTERMALHEAYKSPVVGIGETVLFKRRKEPFWGIATVMPPTIHGWKPGDTFNTKRIRLHVPNTPFGKTPIEEDCVHINDPYYSTDPHSIVSAWEKISAESFSASNMMALITAATDKIARLETELAQVTQLASNQTAELSKLGAQISMAKSSPDRTPRNRNESKALQESAA